MKKPKEIPVYLNGKFIEEVKEVPMLVHKLYNKWWPIWKVKKIYHSKGKKVVMENKWHPAYEVKGA